MLAGFESLRDVLNPPSSAHDETLADVERALANGGAVIAWEDWVPVGTARFARRVDHVYVSRVAVLPSHRRRGVASGIMHFLETWLLAEGFTEFRVMVRWSLQSNVALYESLGYEVVGIVDHDRGPDRTATMVKRF
jgi:ribosomal protein S18 acetylase RimI-like enzyme